MDSQTNLVAWQIRISALGRVAPRWTKLPEGNILRIICGQQEFPSFNGARDSKEKLFRVASSLGISIGNIEQLLVRQFIIKKEEDYQTIARLVRMIAEQ